MTDEQTLRLCDRGIEERIYVPSDSTAADMVDIINRKSELYTAELCGDDIVLNAR